VLFVDQGQYYANTTSDNIKNKCSYSHKDKLTNVFTNADFMRYLYYSVFYLKTFRIVFFVSLRQKRLWSCTTCMFETTHGALADYIH